MGRVFYEYVENARHYSCKCGAHIAAAHSLLSKAFHCRYGRAYLFDTVINILVGPREERIMTTGLHTVSDIQCKACMQVVGWRYDEAFEPSQKYKEGKYILERIKMTDGARYGERYAAQGGYGDQLIAGDAGGSPPGAEGNPPSPPRLVPQGMESEGSDEEED